MTEIHLKDAEDARPEFKDLPNGAFFRFTTYNSIYIKLHEKYPANEAANGARMTCVCVHAAINSDEVGRPYYVGGSTRVIQIHRVDIHL